jgi:uncharacterized membrane protein YqjE
MDVKTVEDGMPPSSSTQGENGGNASVLENAQSIWHELLGLSHDRLHLAGLKTQQAGLSLVSMVTAGVLIAGLLSVAWLGVLVSVVFWLIETGVMTSSAILLVVALNLVLALILVRVIRHKSHYLQFPATLRSLHTKSPDQRDAKRI